MMKSMGTVASSYTYLHLVGALQFGVRGGTSSFFIHPAKIAEDKFEIASMLFSLQKQDFLFLEILVAK